MIKTTFDAHNSRCVLEEENIVRILTLIRAIEYTAKEHPYSKEPGRPETFSDYNQGWEDACLCIRERLEALEGR